MRLFGTPAEQLRQAIGFPARLANRALANAGSQLEVMNETIVEIIMQRLFLIRLSERTTRMYLRARPTAGVRIATSTASLSPFTRRRDE